MAKQRTFASLAWTTKRKVTRRERFLAAMDAVIPWAPLLALIEPHYPTAGRGRRPVGLADAEGDSVVFRHERPHRDGHAWGGA